MTTELPSPDGSYHLRPLQQTDGRVFVSEEHRDRRPLPGVLYRGRWLICGCTVLVLIVAAVFTHLATPVFEATTTLRIDDKQRNLPEIFKTLSTQNQVGTEMEELRSRTLVEDATTQLGLQVRLTNPGRLRRRDLLDNVHVSRTAPAARYLLRPISSGGFLVFDKATGAQLTQVLDSGAVTLPGLSFHLQPGARSFGVLEMQVRPFEEVVLEVAEEIKVAQASREANIVTIRYRDTDSDLVWRVPSLIASRFIERRQQVQKSETRSTIAFLRQQLDTISVQLKSSENALRGYRERNRVVDPQAEATSQVNRLVSMQAERGVLDAERAALARLLEEVDAKAAHRGVGEPSPYRQLMAFPTLLRSGAASQLLQALATAEESQTALLARRTPEDPDVKALGRRISDLEAQLRSVGQTYLQGLSNQVASLDGQLQNFSQQLSAIPEKELAVARLEREPRVLEEMYTLIQRRWKEAQIAEAADDPSVRVVDEPVPPLAPIRPKPLLNMLGALIAGVLLGAGGALAREAMDRAVRTRHDVRRATGLPVLGFIPRIRSRNKPIRLIVQKSRSPIPVPASGTKTAVPGSPSLVGDSYTFLTGPDLLNRASEVPPMPPATPGPGPLRLSLTGPGRAIAEAYGSLYINIAFSRPGMDTKTLVLTSPLAGEGKTTCSVNLALVLAHRGLRVLLIDADLRRGAVHRAFEAPPTPGLAEVMLGSVPFPDARRVIQLGENRTMDYLPTGKLTPSPSGLLESGAFADLLSRLREHYDNILIDSPPVNIVTDAAVIGTKVDGVVIIVRAGVTDSAALAHALEQLRHTGSPVLGVVLNDIDFRKDSSYDSIYRYHNYNNYLGATADVP